MNIEELQQDIKNAYENGVTILEAERLAAKFLLAQMSIAEKLRVIDLDTRMKKSGVKAIRAAVYLDEAGRAEKRPTEATLEARLNSNDLVMDNQKLFDQAEVDLDRYQNLFNILKDGHLYFRGISRGRYE